MALLAMCFHDTKENERSQYSEKCLASLVKTVNIPAHRIFLIDNQSCKKTKDMLIDMYLGYPSNVSIIGCKNNIGTAAGINKALIQRDKKEVCIKIDNDIIWREKGWVDKMVSAIYANKDIGVLGLKRDDVWQRPDHENPAYRTTIEGELEICKDIMGTCTAFNPLLLDKVGFLQQPSVYGFDDVLMSARSYAAGFRNAFLPSIKIVHLDPCTSEYSEWKRQEAGKYIGEVSKLCDLIVSGKADYYYDGK